MSPGKLHSKFPHQMCLNDCFGLNFLVFYKASCLINFLKNFKIMTKFWVTFDLVCFMADLNVGYGFSFGFNTVYLNKCLKQSLESFCYDRYIKLLSITLKDDIFSVNVTGRKQRRLWTPNPILPPKGRI